MDDRAGHIEDNVISTARQPYQRIMLRAWHDESFCASDIAVKAPDARRSVVGNNIAPELRSKADDEVYSPCSGSWFTDSGDCRGKLLAFLRVQNVKLQVRMRGRSKSEDSSLRRVHAGIISGTILADVSDLDRVAAAKVPQNYQRGTRPRLQTGSASGRRRPRDTRPDFLLENLTPQPADSRFIK